MNNIDHYDKATLNLEYARAVTIAISATHQDTNPLLSNVEIEALTSLVTTLIEDAKTELSELDI